MIPNFETTAMVDGARYESRSGEVVSNRVRQIGEMRFESGQILVSDGFVADFETDPALDRRVPVGPHPVLVAEASVGELTDIVAAWVRFSDREIATWTHAFYEGYEPDDNYEPGFGVDSGTACIADRGAAAAVNSEEAGERLLAEFVEHSSVGPHAQFHPDCEDFFICSSGIGDGFYTSYWGNDADGEPVALVVDFNMLTVPVFETATVTTPLPRGQTVARFDRSSVTVQTSWLPIFGPRRLVARGGMPRVWAALAEGRRRIAPERSGMLTSFVLDVPAGTEIEIGARTGYRPAEPV